MRRRRFITLIGGAAAWLLPWMRPARAQNPTPANSAAADQMGQVATLQGSASVIRAHTTAAIALKVADPIFINDTLATSANSTLGVTFDDETTFSLSSNTRVVVNQFVYQQDGNGNAASFNVAVGTATFVASLVAKTGDMKISTPVATLGIRGTTGVVDVPVGGAAGGGDVAAGEPRVKLYADADGHVGRIEVFSPQGERLGALTQGASAFVLRPGPGGRLAAVPFAIPAAEAARDRGLLQRLFVSHNIGRRMAIARRRARLRQQRQQGRPQQRFNRNPRQPGRRPWRR